MGGKNLTQDEYNQIKTASKLLAVPTVAKTFSRGESTVRQIRNSNNFDDYQKRYYKRRPKTKPSFWVRLKAKVGL